jgi:RNA-directed DNA polymerase
MYENRETSELTARGSGAGRPEEADCRKTGANGAEESDCAVVLMNEPNEEEPSKEGVNAEAGEGRARTKESISQAHTNPTQGGKKGVFQGLAGVRQAARAKKGERFTSLLHYLTPEQLQASFNALKREAAAGVDGVRWK